MRTFEALLIVANLLSLVLSFKKQSQAIWLGAAGANLSAFLIHGIFEGPRYQMVFFYFEGRLNLDQIGIIGHSVGGAVAYNLAINDSRVKAAINLDGRVYITPEDARAMAPFLMIASDTFHVTLQDRKSLLKKFEEMMGEEQQNILFMYGSKEIYQEAYNKDYQNTIGLIEALETSGNLFTIAGSSHMKFTDIGLFIGAPQLRELIGIGGKTDPAKCLEITKAVTLAFFDEHLKGESKNFSETLITKYPELKRVDLK